MLRALILAVTLTMQCTWTAEATDVHWLCYAGTKTPRGPATLCWPAGIGDESAPIGVPLAGWKRVKKDEAPRWVDVSNPLGRISVHVRGAARLVLAPADGGACVPRGAHA